MINRVILIVLDSLGIGEAADAARFDDQGANTLQHIADFCISQGKQLHLPNLCQLGLGHLVLGPLCQRGAFNESIKPIGAYAAMEELSPGKDTSTGHWEIAGTVLEKEFPTFPQGFSKSLLDEWCQRNQLPGYLANHSASGTEVIKQYGYEHLLSGKPIVYTSADSVFQVAWHEGKFGLDKLYAICKDARLLLDPVGVGRVIARPFVGDPASFKRTENRRDFSLPPPRPNMLDVLVKAGYFVAGVGKIEDIYCHRSVPQVNHTGRNETSLDATLEFMENLSDQRGLIFTNLIDFDQLHGHRRNPQTYADALIYFDAFLEKILTKMANDDLLILTADHGNDPTFKGTDHTRENVPLLIYSKHPNFKSHEFGLIKGFHSVARLVLESLGLKQHISQIGGLAQAPVLSTNVGIIA